MSKSTPRLIWDLVDTKLAAQLLKAKTPEDAQKIAKQAGHDVPADQLGKDAPKLLVTRTPNKPKMSVEAGASSKESSSNETSSQSASSKSSSNPPNRPYRLNRRDAQAQSCHSAENCHTQKESRTGHLAEAPAQNAPSSRAAGPGVFVYFHRPVL